MFSPEEWTVIRTGLDIVTVQGKDAKSLSMLQSKVEKEIQKSINKILNIPRPAKTFVAVSVDCFACVISIWASFYLRLGDLVYLSEKGFEALILALVLSLPIFYSFGLYKAIFRHSGTYALLKVSRAIFVYSIFYITFISFIGIRGLPRSIGLIQPLILLIKILIIYVIH